MDESAYIPDFYDMTSFGVEGDSDFYLEEARGVTPPVLELACGTGRVVIPLAEAGIPVVGLDISPEMLAKARQKIAACPEEVQKRVELVEGDMRDLRLEQQFELILIPYRAFQHLMTPQDQRKALLNIRGHLSPKGHLIINLFDPRISRLVDSLAFTGSAPRLSQDAFVHPVTGNRVLVWSSTKPSLEEQHVSELWTYEELNGNGETLRRQHRTLNLRWTYRYEMEYLFELCGYRVLVLYGDFKRGPFRHGGEQIWVVELA